MKKLLMTMLALALLAGCTSQKSTPAEKPQPKPAEFETGRVAFQKMYVAAHGWARDAQPFRMQSRITADCNGHDALTHVYSVAALQNALATMPATMKEYTDCQDVIGRALTNALGSGHGKGGGSGGGGGSFLPTPVIVILVLLALAAATFGAIAVRRRRGD